MSPESLIWKGDYEGTYPIEVGDKIFAWGQPYEGGKVVDVEKMWVNIVNLRGKIADIQPTEEGFQLRLHDARTGSHLIRFDKQTLIVLENQDEMITDSKVRLTDGVQVVVLKLKAGINLKLNEGQAIQVIGMRLKHGSIKAGRIWVGK